MRGARERRTHADDVVARLAGGRAVGDGDDEERLAELALQCVGVLRQLEIGREAEEERGRTHGAGRAEQERLDDLLVERLRTTTAATLGQLQVSRACRSEDEGRKRGRGRGRWRGREGERETVRRTVPSGVRPEKRICETSCCADASLVMLRPTSWLLRK